MAGRGYRRQPGLSGVRFRAHDGGRAARRQLRRLQARVLPGAPTTSYPARLATVRGMTSPGDGARVAVGGRDAVLDARLDDELTAYNLAASGSADQREVSVRVDDGAGLVAGLSGWTWGTCAGIAMVWVR